MKMKNRVKKNRRNNGGGANGTDSATNKPNLAAASTRSLDKTQSNESLDQQAEPDSPIKPVDTSISLVSNTFAQCGVDVKPSASGIPPPPPLPPISFLKSNNLLQISKSAATNKPARINHSDMMAEMKAKLAAKRRKCDADAELATSSSTSDITVKLNSLVTPKVRDTIFISSQSATSLHPLAHTKLTRHQSLDVVRDELCAEFRSMLSIVKEEIITAVREQINKISQQP